jgi:hypothetical protein
MEDLKLFSQDRLTLFRSQPVLTEELEILHMHVQEIEPGKQTEKFLAKSL